MARKKKTKKDILEEAIEETYETFIEYDCPVRGRVKQKVLVKRIRDNTSSFGPTVYSSDALEDLGVKDSGLPLNEDEDGDSNEEN